MELSSDLIIIKATVSQVAKPDIVTADFKYNKEVALSFGFDDALINQYWHAFPLFNGGKSRLNGKTYPGLKYTDGTGKKIAFRGTLVIPAAGMREDENAENPASFSAKEARQMINAGWGISNHSWKHGGGPSNPNYYNRLYDVKQAERIFWDKLRIRPLIGTTPAAEPGFMYTFLNTGYLCHYSNCNEGNSDLTRWGRMNSRNVPEKPFNLDRAYRGDEFRNDEMAYKKAYIDEIFDASDNGNKEFGTDFTHGPGKPDNVDAFYTYALKHPKNKNQDRLWVPNVQEFLEYFEVKRDTTIKYALSGNELTITIDQSKVHYNIRHRDMSLLLSGMKLDGVKSSSGANEVTFNPATGLINIYALNTTKVRDPSLDVLPAQIVKMEASGNSVHVIFDKPVKQTEASAYTIKGKKAMILSGTGQSWYLNFKFPVKGLFMSYQSHLGDARTEITGLKVCDYIDYPIK
jgi:hypothetical protein